MSNTYVIEFAAEHSTLVVQGNPVKLKEPDIKCTTLT